MDTTITEAGLIPGAEQADAPRTRSAEPFDLGAVFDANAAALYRTILAYTGGRGDLAEDAVAEAFARAAAQPTAKLRDPVAWLYRSARNAVIDHYRLRHTHSPLDNLDWPDPDDYDREPNDATREHNRCNVDTRRVSASAPRHLIFTAQKSSNSRGN